MLNGGEIIMSKLRKIRSVISGLLAGTLFCTAIYVNPSGSLIGAGDVNAVDSSNTDGNGFYYHDTFEDGNGDWVGRGGAVVATDDKAYAGSKALYVSNRKDAWHGAMKTLDTSIFKSGDEFSFSVAVSGTGNMMLSLQYTDPSGGTKYDHIANGQSSGDYILLSNTNYKLPDGSDYILYVETEDGNYDFSIDEAIAAQAGINVNNSHTGYAICGDFDSDGMVTTFDIIGARKALLSYTADASADIRMDIADVDGNNIFAISDLVVLSKFVLGQINLLPRSTATTTTTTTTTSETTTTTKDSGESYMSSIRNQITASVPSSALGKAVGGVEHITYFSKKANRNKGANVWLPPGYDKNQKYPVFYVNHGYGGDESSMINGMGVLEIATTLIKSGEAEPMIIVFTNQYTDPQHEKQTGNGQADVPGYDNFVEDLPDSLMPYIESHYPVKTGRENTAIAGFSMGGREALYIGMKCCDKIGYIGGGAPAPGIFPTRDQFMNHPGVMSKDEIRIDPPYSPYLLMIAGGTNDGMVNDYPKQYSDLFTQHGTENIYISVPGGGHDSSTVIPLMYNFIRHLFKAT